MKEGVGGRIEKAISDIRNLHIGYGDIRHTDVLVEHPDMVEGASVGLEVHVNGGNNMSVRIPNAVVVPATGRPGNAVVLIPDISKEKFEKYRRAMEQTHDKE